MIDRVSARKLRLRPEHPPIFHMQIASMTRICDSTLRSDIDTAMAQDRPPPPAKGAANNNKRKEPPTANRNEYVSHNAKRSRNGHHKPDFRSKQREARALSTQTSSKAFKNGEMDVDKFVRSREYEIRALEEGMARSKQALTKRAFQQVPRDLRRRTASHNVKKVPKRLRARGKREVRSDEGRYGCHGMWMRADDGDIDG